MRGEGSIATVKIVCLLDVDVRGLCLVAFEAPRCPRGERPRHTGNSGFIAIHGSCVWLYGEGALTPHKATRDARALPEARADGSLLRLVVEGSTGAPPFAPPARCLFLVPTLHVPCLKTRHRITVGATGLVVNLRGGPNTSSRAVVLLLLIRSRKFFMLTAPPIYSISV